MQHSVCYRCQSTFQICLFFCRKNKITQIQIVPDIATRCPPQIGFCFLFLFDTCHFFVNNLDDSWHRNFTLKIRFYGTFWQTVIHCILKIKLVYPLSMLIFGQISCFLGLLWSALQWPTSTKDHVFQFQFLFPFVWNSSSCSIYDYPIYYPAEISHIQLMQFHSTNWVFHLEYENRK